MVFSSHLFVFYFLPSALLAYYLLMPRRGQHLVLTLFSYVFYGWANPRFVVLMFVSTAIDYLAGLVQAHNGFRGWRQPIELLEPGGPRTRTQKAALVISVVSNLSLLGFFKYFNFATDNYSSLVALLGLPGLRLDHVLRVTLPLGISFYTFQSMSYSIDVYRGHARGMSNFIDFACFVSMFPQLVAGPIIRFSEVADQLRHRTVTLDKFARGVALFSTGLAMKVLLANPCGKVADTVFSAGHAAPVDAWFGVAAYAFQIFFDFAGYSEMAIGMGLLLGFVFAKNFDAPYRSESITEFWRRWHISLSSWLRDYLYIPLGGNRKGRVRTYANLMLTMLLGGLWHGASWNFVIWGGIQGGMLAFERSRGKSSPYQSLPRPARVALTFLVVLVSWVFFRAHTLRDAVGYLGCMMGAVPAQPGAHLVAGVIYRPYYVVTFLVAAVAVWCLPTPWEWTQKLTWRKAAACAGLLWLSLIVLAIQAYNPFIYFIF